MSKENNDTITDKNAPIDKIKEVTPMTTLANTDRYCTIEESIVQSFKEVKMMREGKLPKKTWNDYLKEHDKENSKEK